jgi:cytochrome c oxidase subunit III
VKKKKESFFSLISQKPWEDSQSILDNEHDGKTLAISKAKLGVRTVMVVSGIIFSLFVISYSDRMLVHDWKSLPEPWLLWINTVILILTSIVFHKTKVLAENNEFEKTKNSLLVVGFLTFAFVTGQLLVWQHFVNLGQYASTNPANAFFYVLTALHGLHILGGLYFWAKVTTKLFKRNYNVSKIKHNIELCAIYWHFLLIVWFVLFGLMVAT